MAIAKRIIIELSPAGIDGALLSGGRVRRSTHVPLGALDWRQAWEEGLSPFDAPLNALLEELGVSGVNADVVYRSPTSFAETITVPVTGSAVTSATTLAMADHVGFPLDQNPHLVEPIVTSRFNGARSTHTLAIADSSAVSETLRAWVGRAGLRMTSACPSSALSIIDAVTEASEQRTDGITARLYFDRYCAMLTVASGSAVRLVRRIEIGFEDFVATIARTVTPRNSESGGVVISRSMARTVLCEHGIANSSEAIDGLGALTGKDLLPLIQPVLQRLGIEIKQSLRFELSPEERDEIKLTCCGPFGGMPNIASAISEQSEISSSGVGSAKPLAESVATPFLGDTGRAVRLSRLSRDHALLAGSITSDLRVDSLRVGLRAGVVAAAIALGATAYMTSAQIQSERAATRGLGAAMETVDNIVKMNDSILVRSRALAATHQRMQSTIGTSMRWSDVLTVMPGLIPDSVVLLDIEGAEHTQQDPAKLVLTGVAEAEGERSSQDALNAFIGSLNDCPLIESVELGSTNRVGAREEETEAMRFGLIARLVTTPRLLISGAEEETGQ